ncbi:MAG: hypothetical protein C5B46_02505 [Proteobacteria bacterium]|nr:MAG: hypothetical protein C5B46_02505 [Pseudomonadota bacterium]
MLLPLVRLRKLWLERALRGYPLYDPPHKVEEHLLSREKAVENFDYFMHVRQQRIAYFQGWLRQHFRVLVTPDGRGVRALNRWGNKYAGLLLVTDQRGRPNRSYFTYDPPWTGENARYNVLFDMGTLFGEIIIANRPNLRWDVDPISAFFPRTAKMLKRSPGMSFQRPSLIDVNDPVFEVHPLHDAWGFAYDMTSNLTTFEGINRYHSRDRESRRRVREGLVNIFNAALRDDTSELRKRMSPEEYLKLIDAVESGERGNGDE